MAKFKDLTGQRFGNLTVLERIENYITPKGHSCVQWRCQCDCGNIRNVISSNLLNGTTTKCEECTKKKYDLTGQTFGELKVLRRIEDYVSSGGNVFVQYLCLCSCGQYKTVTALKLRSGHTKSCGKCGAFEKRVDLVGRVFDKLTVIDSAGEYTYPDGSHDVRWRCKCECGREVIIRGNSLKNDKFGHSCEYCRRHKRSDFLDMIGVRNGKLVVVSRAPDRYSVNNTIIDRWNCKCDCGNEVVVDGTRIRHGYTKSCGCSRDDAFHNKPSSCEILIEDYLNEHGFCYVSQKTFDGLVGVNGGRLRYDFYIDDDIKFLLECQGDQHYKPVDFFGGSQGFETLQEHDNRKMIYAVSNNIPLLQLDCRRGRSENDMLFDLDLFVKNIIESAI